jgi:8-oxo-dGTP diphosphatase
VSDNLYLNKVRVRICGILVLEEKILLVRHQGLGPLGYFWSPPGGGLEFGESVQDAVEREFREETCLDVSGGPFLGFHEHRDGRFHALELFFSVAYRSGTARLGLDPEGGGQVPKLAGLQFWDAAGLKGLPEEALHSRIRDFFPY